jgi:hypothetical protein
MHCLGSDVLHLATISDCLQPHGIVQGLLETCDEVIPCEWRIQQCERKRLIVRRLHDDKLRQLQDSQKFGVA